MHRRIHCLWTTFIGWMMMFNFSLFFFWRREYSTFSFPFAQTVCPLERIFALVTSQLITVKWNPVGKLYLQIKYHYEWAYQQVKALLQWCATKYGLHKRNETFFFRILKREWSKWTERMGTKAKRDEHKIRTNPNDRLTCPVYVCVRAWNSADGRTLNGWHDRKNHILFLCVYFFFIFSFSL